MMDESTAFIFLLFEEMPDWRDEHNPTPHNMHKTGSRKYIDRKYV